jgi:hypothetical protein
MADPVAKFRLPVAKRVLRATRRVELAPRGQESACYGKTVGNEFWAKITGSAAFTDNPNRWQYAWTEQRPTLDGWEDLPGGRSGTTSSRFALNSIEASNPDTAGVMGNSVDTDATSTTLAAVQGAPVVWMRRVSAWDADEETWSIGFRFSYENTVECGS